MDKANNEIKKHGAINGILNGIIVLVFRILSFYFIITIAKSMLLLVVGPIIFSTVIPLIAAIWLSFDLRKKIGGFWNFRQATTGLFIMFFMTFAISTIGNYTFSKLVEPDMIDKMKTAFVTTTQVKMEKQNIPQETIDKKVSEIEANFDSQKNESIGNTLKGIGIAIILDFVVALIFAAFLKKERLLQADNVYGDISAPDADPTA